MWDTGVWHPCCSPQSRTPFWPRCSPCLRLREGWSRREAASQRQQTAHVRVGRPVLRRVVRAGRESRASRGSCPNEKKKLQKTRFHFSKLMLCPESWKLSQSSTLSLTNLFFPKILRLKLYAEIHWRKRKSVFRRLGPKHYYFKLLFWAVCMQDWSFERVWGKTGRFCTPPSTHPYMSIISRGVWTKWIHPLVFLCRFGSMVWVSTM